MAPTGPAESRRIRIVIYEKTQEDVDVRFIHVFLRTAFEELYEFLCRKR